YPTMRLFRQHTLGDWNNVISRVITELEKTAQPQKTKNSQPSSTTDINTLFSQGIKLVEQGNIEQALNNFTYINERHPRNTQVLYNIAGCYRRLGQLEEAAKEYNQVLSLDPKHTDAAFGLALVRHTQGDMKQGWELFNLWRKDIDLLPKSPLQLIDKKVLIKVEWGLGDMINFIRYAQYIHELGAHVIVQSHKALVKLLTRCPYIDTVIPHGAPLPQTDFQLPLLYLPTLFQTEEKTVPNSVPYLNPDAQLEQYWHDKLATDSNFKVGICWDMGHYDTNVAGWKRAAPLEHWHQLLRTKEVSFYCLQKEQLDQLAALPTDIKVHQLGPDFDTKNGGFMDSAAIMKQLNLIITVDTAVAHLAGALGVPTWVMLPYHTDYRWMRDRIDTPWYPTMRLFRSQNPDDWKPVIENVTEELKKLTHKNKEIS
ncbi:tetratricopeptide repeat-containing glycosyltransferase family protein, partial [Methylicorpusculum sp.]|uniref:tetratricopeptide repeat-containing glycosyltransferase family protein n=1 Tax=Methylicorpusculum sp. TaxID=2713644 RepID=UPI002AB86899